MTSVPNIFECRRGAVGDLIYSVNAHGPYSRPRSAVTDPDTALQTDQRADFGYIAASWRDLLTQSQRDAWHRFAAQRSHSNACAQEYPWSGQCEFQHSNVARVHAGLGLVESPPARFDDSTLRDATLEQDSTTNLLRITVHPDDEWVRTDGAYLLVYRSPLISSARTFYRRPHNFIHAKAGSSTAPPLAPFVINAVFSPAPTTDGNVNIKLTAVLPDGRVTLPRYQTIPWLQPPSVILVQAPGGPTIQVQFDLPLEPTSIPAGTQFPKRFAPRNPTSRYFFIGADYTRVIDPDEPDWLILHDETPSIVGNAAAISYAASAAPYLRRQGSLVRVLPFDLPVPWP